MLTQVLYEGNMCIYVRTYEGSLAHIQQSLMHMHVVTVRYVQMKLGHHYHKQHAPLSQLLLGIHAQDSHCNTANAEKLQCCATRGLTSGQCSWIKWRIGPTNSCLYMIGRTRPSFSADKQHTTGEGNDSISATGNST